MQEFLVVIAIRTDQHGIEQRLGTILAATAPSRGGTVAEINVREAPTVAEANALQVFCGYDVLAALGWIRPPS